MKPQIVSKAQLTKTIAKVYFLPFIGKLAIFLHAKLVNDILVWSNLITTVWRQ